LFNRQVNHEECKVVYVSRVGQIKTADRKRRVEIFLMRQCFTVP